MTTALCLVRMRSGRAIGRAGPPIQVSRIENSKHGGSPISCGRWGWLRFCIQAGDSRCGRVRKATTASQLQWIKSRG